MRHAPFDFGGSCLLHSVYQIKLLVAVNADQKLIGSILDSSRDVAIWEVYFGLNHQKFECLLDRVSLEFSKVESVVTEERDFVLATRLDHVKDCVDLQGLGLKNSLVVIEAEHVDMAEMLSKDQELLFLAALIVLINHDVVDTLLELLVLFPLKSVEIEHE